MKKTRFTVVQLVTDAMLSAVCAVLGYYALDLTSIKITFESLPVFIAALLFGPVDGAVVGGIGTLIYQLVKYGFTATTFLWMLPYIILGFGAGLYAKKRNFRFGSVELVVLCVICELTTTALNTFVILFDSKLYGWYYPTLITGSLVIRIVISIVKAVAFGLIMKPLLTAVRRNGGAAFAERVPVRSAGNAETFSPEPSTLVASCARNQMRLETASKEEKKHDSI